MNGPGSSSLCASRLMILSGKGKTDASPRLRGRFHHPLQDLGNRIDSLVVYLDRIGKPCDLLDQLAGLASNRRKRTNARMISMFTRTAVGERNTLESIATPCSVKTQGGFRAPPCPKLEVAFCDFKSVTSCCVS